MSLYALTVTTTDISQLQQGILFTTTNAADISNQVSSINDPRFDRDGELLRQSIARQCASYIASGDGRDRADDGANPDGCDVDQSCDEPGYYSVICQFCAGE